MEILQSCDRFGYLTTSQIQRLHNLGGRRNTTRILSDMGDLLSSFREGETVWYLSGKGRKEIGSSNIKRKTPHVQHTVIRNEVFLWMQPEQWREEFTLKWDDNTIITDALYTLDGQYGFLEIDITQSMIQNEKKIDMYKRLQASGRWQAKHGPFPEVLYVTISEYRKEKLSKMLGDLQGRVVTVNDIK